MKFSNLILLVLPLLVGACGSHNDSNEAPAKVPAPLGPSQPKNLSAMTLPEVLATKYDSVTLNCNLWTRMNGPLVISDTPNDSVSFDIIANPTFPKIINLKAKSKMHTLAIQIKLTEIKLQNGGLGDSFGASYHVKNSPTVHGEYAGQSATEYPEGFTGGPFQGNSLEINENIVRSVVASSSGPQDEPSPTVDYVDCALTTKVKPTYKDEWIQENVGNEPACLLGQPVIPLDCMIRTK